MQLILREDVPKLGRSGDSVAVRDGYGRNYLIPRGLAVLASTKNLAEIEHHKRIIDARERKRMKSAESIKARLESISINITKQVGDGDKLFGSVTTRDIVDALAGNGVTIDRKAVVLDQPIRTIGMHVAKVRLARDFSAELKVWVVAK